MQDQLRQLVRSAVRWARDRMELQTQAAHLAGPLRELVAEVDALRDEVGHLRDQLSIETARSEVLIDEVRALRDRSPS